MGFIFHALVWTKSGSFALPRADTLQNWATKALVPMPSIVSASQKFTTVALHCICLNLWFISSGVTWGVGADAWVQNFWGVQSSKWKIKSPSNSKSYKSWNKIGNRLTWIFESIFGVKIRVRTFCSSKLFRERGKSRRRKFLFFSGHFQPTLCHCILAYYQLTIFNCFKASFYVCDFIIIRNSNWDNTCKVIFVQWCLLWLICP